MPPAMLLSLAQVTVIVGAADSIGPIVAAIIGGAFLLINTIITVILTRALGKNESDREYREAKELEIHQRSGDRSGSYTRHSDSGGSGRPGGSKQRGRRQNKRDQSKPPGGEI